MENKVLAKVAGRDITADYITEIISRYPAQQQAMLNTEHGRKNVLEQAIGFELMYEFAKESGLDKSEEYVNQLNKIAKELLAQMVMSKTLSEVNATEEDALAYYNSNKEMFVEPANVSAKHILVDSEESCKAIREKIASGELTFEEAANQYSSCPSKEQGGNLGAFSKGMMVPEFEAAAFELPIGEISEPVQTQFGYHLIKVEAKNEGSTQPFEDVKEMVIKQLLQQNQEKRYLEFVTELRNKYGVTML